MAMYSDAVKTTGYEGRLVVTDIARLVASAVGFEEAPVFAATKERS
jgi:hypothetical protein